MLSDEDRKRIEEEELHRYKIRVHLEAPRRRRITLITLAGVVLLLLGWLVISSVQEAGRSASALTIRESVIAYDNAATALLQEKGTTDYTARVHIVPFSPQFVGALSPGRYRVEVNYQVDRRPTQRAFRHLFIWVHGGLCGQVFIWAMHGGGSG